MNAWKKHETISSLIKYLQAIPTPLQKLKFCIMYAYVIGHIYKFVYNFI